MTEVGTVNVVLKLEDSHYRSGMNAAEGRARDLDRSLSRPFAIGISAGAAMAVMQELIHLAGQLADAVGPGVAMSWEKGFAGVLKTVDTSNVTKLNDELLQLRSTMRDVSLSEIQQGAGILGSADIGADEIKEATKVVLEAKAAFDGLTLDETARQLGLITGLWDEQTKAVGGNVEMMKKSASAVNELGNQKRATEKNLLEFLSEFGGTANTYNIDVAGATALGGLLESKGVYAQEASTWIRSALMEGLLSKTVDTSKEPRGYKLAAQLLGIDDETMKQRISTNLGQSFIDIFNAIDAKLPGEANAASRTQYQQMIFGSYGSQLNKLTGTQGEFNEYLAIATEGFDKGTSAHEEYIRQTDNLTSAITELNGALDVFKIRSWENALGPAKGHVQALAQAVRDATPQIQEWAAAIWSGDTGKAMDAFEQIKESVVGAIQGLGPMATEALENWDWESAGSVIGDIIGEAIDLAIGGFDWTWQNGQAILDAALELGKGLATAIYNTLLQSQGLQNFTNAAVGAFNAVGRAAASLASGLITTIVGAINIVIGKMADLAGAAYDTYQNAKSFLGATGSPGESLPSWIVPGAKYQRAGKTNASIRNWDALPSDATASDWVRVAAKGGFFTNTPVLMGEAGREAYVPIGDRAAGIAMLPQLMRELGIPTMADGGILGDFLKPLTPINWGEIGQVGMNALTTFNTVKGGALAQRVNAEAAEEIRAREANGESLTSYEKSIVKADDSTKNFNATIDDTIKTLQDAADAEDEETSNPWHDELLKYQITPETPTWTDIETPILKNYALQEDATEEEKTQTQEVKQQTEILKGISSLGSIPVPGLFPIKGALGMPGMVAQTAAVPYTNPLIPPVGSFAYQTGAAYFRDYPYRISGPDSYLWGKGGLPNVDVNGNVPTAWLSEGQPTGMDWLEPQILARQMAARERSVQPWFVRGPQEQPAWWTSAASGISPQYDWTAPKGGTVPPLSGGSPNVNKALTNRDIWNAIYDNNGTCIAFVEPDSSLNFTPGKDYLPGGKGYGNLDQPVELANEERATLKAIERNSANTVTQIISLGQPTLRAVGATVPAGGGVPPADPALARNSWNLIYNNRGQCIAYVEPDPSLVFTPGPDYIPGGKRYEAMVANADIKSYGDQEMESMGDCLEDILKESEATEKNTQETAKALNSPLSATGTVGALLGGGGAGGGGGSSALAALIAAGMMWAPTSGLSGWGTYGSRVGGRYGSAFGGGWYTGGAAGSRSSAMTGFMNTAASSMGGSIQWAEGGLVSRPELFLADGNLNVRGEAGPELILPLTNPKRTYELLNRYLPMRSFAGGGLAGSLPNVSVRSGGQTVNLPPIHIHGANQSDAQLERILNKTMRAAVKEVAKELWEGKQ